MKTIVVSAFIVCLYRELRIVLARAKELSMVERPILGEDILNYVVANRLAIISRLLKNPQNWQSLA